MSKLVDKVLNQIKKDVAAGDVTAIEELVAGIPEEKLKGFLSEADELDPKHAAMRDYLVWERVTMSVLLRDYGLGITDVDEDQLKASYAGNDTPQEFVDWFGRKYDLDKVDAQLYGTNEAASPMGGDTGVDADDPHLFKEAKCGYCGEPVEHEDAICHACKPSDMRGASIGESFGHWAHDAGAYARCSYCGRYTDNKAVMHGDYACDCGKTEGWSGSFLPPNKNSTWNEGKTDEEDCACGICDECMFRQQDEAEALRRSRNE